MGDQFLSASMQRNFNFLKHPKYMLNQNWFCEPLLIMRNLIATSTPMVICFTQRGKYCLSAVALTF